MDAVGDLISPDLLLIQRADIPMKRTVSSVAMLMLTAACIAGCGTQSPSTAATEEKMDSKEGSTQFKTLEDRFSYAYGADLAEKFKAEGIGLNVDLLVDGMRAVFEGADKKMSTDEVAATMQVFEQAHLKKKETERAAAADKNQQQAEAFLSENAKKHGVIVTKSGLQYRVIRTGTGSNKPTLDDEVKVHYRARFIDGTEFDSTYKRNQPYSVNARMLIEGWAEALQLMSEGSKWELYIPADLAYGEKGSDPYVGPNAVLIFEVELLEIESPKES
jgi:FKBP-type peptidyl-prolyl cis-trans isomerase